MPTVRSKISKKNPYYIPEHRFLELKHFCLQYPKWNEALASMNGFSMSGFDKEKLSKTNNVFDPTMKNAMIRQFYRDRIDMVEQAAKDTDPLLSRYILCGTTEGRSFDYLKMCWNIPCDRNTYYDRYRKFFWHLDKLRK